MSSEPGPGRKRQLLWSAVLAAALVLGVVGWVLFALGGDPQRAWRAMLVNFLFFTPLASGMVVWSAAIILAQGRWDEPIKHSALSGITLAPVSLLSFAALVLGRDHWAVFLEFRGVDRGIWHDTLFVFTRDGVGLIVLWGLALLYARRRRQALPERLGAVLALAYALVLSLLAFDLVMALDPRFLSTLFGGYFFISGMYAAVAGWALVAIVSGEAAREHRGDLGSLLLAFSLVTTYFMFSQLIIIWYENLPLEAPYVVARMQLAPWRDISRGLLVTVYLGPLVLLLWRNLKRNRLYLAAVAVMVLCGLWVERWWLVTPSLGGAAQLGLVELSITAAFASAMALGALTYLGRREVPR